jgi:hypothetical protein
MDQITNRRCGYMRTFVEAEESPELIFVTTEDEPERGRRVPQPPMTPPHPLKSPRRQLRARNDAYRV